MSILSNRNRPGFLTDYHHQGIALLRQTDSSPVPGAQFRGQCPVLRQRKQTAGSNQTIAAYHRRTIMQRRIDDKNIEQKIGGNQTIDLNRTTTINGKD